MVVPVTPPVVGARPVSRMTVERHRLNQGAIPAAAADLAGIPLEQINTSPDLVCSY